MLRPRTLHLRRRGVPVHVGTVDCVVVSHGHYDHLDLRSLDLLGRGTRVVLPRGLGGLLRGRRYTDVVEVGVGESVSVGAVEIEATEAEHSGSRLHRRASALGFLLRGTETVYFAGDTDLFPGLDAIGREGVDVALLPVWGWGARLPAGHLTPESAAEAARRVRPRVAVPIHWGTYVAPGGDGSRTPAERFARACGDAVDVRILEPGETLTVPARPVERSG